MAQTVGPAATKSEPTNALAVPAFRALWLSSITFFMVSNALRFVYGWVVLDGLDRGEAAQGIAVFALGVPSWFLLLPAGVWADRLDPKQLLIATQVAMLGVMVATALWLSSGNGSMTLIISSALLAGAATAFGGPVRGSLIPSLLKGDLLYSGIALNAIAMTLSLVVGAVTAKFFGDLFGFSGAFWYLSVLIALGIVALLALRSPGPATTGDKATMSQAIREGLAFVWNERGIRTLFLLLSVSGLIMSPIMFVTVQAHIKTELGRTAGDAAPVFAMMGLGILITSIFVMRRGNMENKSVLFMRAMLCGTTTQVLTALAPHYWQVLGLALVMGMCGGFFINMNQGLIQANTPTEVMGRVMGLYTLVQIGLTPFGALGLGFLAAAVGTRLTMVIGAGSAFFIVLAVYLRSDAIRQIN